MRMYAEALEARLANVGIYFENGDYVTTVASLNYPIIPPTTEGQVGSDFDVDKNEERDNISND